MAKLRAKETEQAQLIQSLNMQIRQMVVAQEASLLEFSHTESLKHPPAAMATIGADNSQSGVQILDQSVQQSAQTLLRKIKTEIQVQPPTAASHSSSYHPQQLKPVQQLSDSHKQLYSQLSSLLE